MEFEQVLANLKNKKYKPVYFLMGNEPYYIDEITNYITENVLTESERSFNQTIFYGKDAAVADIINTARRFPMMSEYQVVVVREAQNLKEIGKLSIYTDNPLKSTILVINYKYNDIDKRLRLYKSVKEHGMLFEFKKLYDNQVAEWVNTYLASRGYKIDPSACVLLTEFLGNDLGKIAGELDKLIIAVGSNVKIITPVTIENNIGISKDFNNFELQKALIEKDVLKANRIVKYFDKNQKNNPLPLTITTLYYFFTKVLILHYTENRSTKNLAAVLKVSPYFVPDYQKAARLYSVERIKRIISMLREYDLKSKGIGNLNTSPGGLLKELIYKIIH
jgi:DNA polymerase-3 subunit delta